MNRKEIRKIYKEEEKHIFNIYPKTNPYITSYDLLNTIERIMWNEIRCIGLPMYYQYPIGKYFADFCDPVKKIVIEVDGKQHRQNIIYDNERDKFMKNLGYKVYRIEASHFLFQLEVEEDKEEYDRCIIPFLFEIKQNNYD
jgi:very-short-patch-repair endonuclease